MTRWIDADAVGSLLEPGMTVFVAGATAEPGGILEALSRNGEQCAGIRFVSVSIPGINRVDFSTFHPGIKTTTFFATPETRQSLAHGRIDYVPMKYSAIYTYLERDVKIDVALVQLPAINKNDSV